MTNKIQILSTKILTTHQKEALLKSELEVIEADFISVKNSNFEIGTLNEYLIFTSQNAVYSVLLHPMLEVLKSKTVFCVGLKTKALLEENGFTVEVYVDYAADLAEIITLIYGKQSYTFFSGNMRRETLPSQLKAAQVDFNEIQVYQTSLSPHKIQAKLDGILFFSPSAVESYLKENKIKNEICFCIGETTAEALEKTAKNIIVAAQPTVEDVIEEVLAEYK